MFDRQTGHGRIQEFGGQYEDARGKGHGVLLLATESTDAFSPALVALLRMLARMATLPSGNDTTVYGTSRASPKAFYQHHAAAISSAILEADSQAILNPFPAPGRFRPSDRQKRPCSRRP